MAGQTPERGHNRPAAALTRCERSAGAGPVAPHPLLALQQRAGNRAVAAAVSSLAEPVVQRAALLLKGGGTLSDVDGPGSNQRAAVLAAQQRLVALEAMDAAGAAADKAKIEAKAPGDPILAADIPNTTAAIAGVEQPTISEPAARKVLRADLVAGVGAGQTNDAGDVDLVLNLLHEEWAITNDHYDRATVILSGVGHTVDPATLPGFLGGLSTLKRGYAGGFPFRGSTATRKKLLVTEGTEAYQRALDHNLKSRDQMKAWLQEAAAQRKDLVLRNSAEWLLSGRSKVFCQTRTHDSAARVKAARKPKHFWAVFGGDRGALTEQMVPYVRKLKGEATFDNTNVAVEAPSGGWESPSAGIGVVEPLTGGKRAFFDAIRHEAQHGADHQPEDDIGNYKSEFNARSVERRFQHLSSRKHVQAMGHRWTERQYAMFLDIWNYPDLYPYLRRNWNDPDPAKRRAWRRMVVQYREASETFNPINSVRIENLHLAMKACGVSDCIRHDAFLQGNGADSPNAAAVRTAIAAMDDLDRKTIRDNMELNQLALTNLAGTLRDEYFAL